MRLLSILFLVSTLFPYSLNSSASDLYKRCVKSVVYIASDTGYGTGVIIDKHTIITNHHVISGYKNVKILPYDKNVVNMSALEAFRLKNSDQYNFIDGEVIAIDPERDLAMITTSSRLVNIANLASSFSGPEINEDVFAIGNPESSPSLFNSTKGSVSALPKDFEFYLGDGVVHKYDMIQTQAPINPGNSGGPLYNMRGYVVGITTLASDVNEEGRIIQLTNFAIHIGEIQDFIKKAKKGDYPSTNYEYTFYGNKNLWKEFFFQDERRFYGHKIVKSLKRDENRDGKADGYCYSISKNRTTDYCKYDNDYDGNFEEEVYWLRTDEMKDYVGHLDWGLATLFRPRYVNDKWVWRIDTNDDGKMDACAYDENGDYLPETLILYDSYKGYFWGN